MAVPVGSGEGFELGTVVALFEFRFGSTNPLAAPYTVTGDGQRFLVLRPQEDASTRPLTVVQNWAALLKK